MKKIQYFIFRLIGKFYLTQYIRVVEALTAGINLDEREKFDYAESLCPLAKIYRINGKNYAEKARVCQLS